MMPPNDLLLFSLLPQIQQVSLEMNWIEEQGDHLVPHGVGLGGKLLILVVCPISSALAIIVKQQGHTWKLMISSLILYALVHEDSPWQRTSRGTEYGQTRARLQLSANSEITLRKIDIVISTYLHLHLYTILRSDRRDVDERSERESTSF
jgi:hypothetical protein